jgi:outer membrane protein assembly factor BamB
VIWGDRLFVSGADEKSRKVFCFDAVKGTLLWQKDVPGTPASTAKPPKISEDTGYAASTMATDGRRAFAIFANGDVAALDFQGNLVWARSLGIPNSSYGYASSLATYKNLLLIQFDQGSEAKDNLSKAMALDGATGKVVWDVRRPVPNSWTSPIVAHTTLGDQFVTAADPWVIAYDPADGKELWRANRLRQDVGPSPVFRGGVIYVVNSSPCLSAIRVDGHGDVTKTHVLWSGEDNLPDICSPLATDDYVFLLDSSAGLTCYDAKGGKKLWEKEVEGACKASPSMVGKYLYLLNDEGKMAIVEPGPKECKPVGTADLGEPCTASPAFHNGRMYLRGAKNLFCIGGGG